MTDFWAQPWFAWGVAIVLGLPVVIIILTEVGGALQRRGNPAAKPVWFLRNFVLPAGALLALLALATDIKADFTWVRVVATVFGFLVLLLLLSGVNVVLFGRPTAGSWRDRLPSIFIDLGRLAIIIVGLAVLFSWVWGADVGGLFTALGVTSIVIGLALQNAVGSIVSGLLLLFEQPFRIGDWLKTSEGTGRVVEVNWRSIHIETGDGILVIPTAGLADGAFTNLSADGAHSATIELSFSNDDAPHDVSVLLLQLAADLPMTDRRRHASVSITGPGSYVVDVAVLSPADESDARSLYLAWLWYAATRAGLHWAGGSGADYSTDERRSDALITIGRTLRVPVASLESHAGSVRLERYAAGETVQRTGEVPDGLRFIVEGAMTLSAELADGSRIPIENLDRGDYVGPTALTNEPVSTTAVAVSPVTMAYLPRASVDALVREQPSLGTRIGSVIDSRRRRAAESVEAIAVSSRTPEALED